MSIRLVLVALLFAASVVGHSYITTLATSATSTNSRSNQKQTNSGCRGPACLGPCDVPTSSPRAAPTPTFRGDKLNIKWPRNNHAGGFIRFAWTQTSGSDIHSNFDNGVQVITCHEVGGCGPDNAADPNGGDSGASDGSFRPCQSNITVPLHLTDGQWTLQWAWFGGAFALGDYYSCVDFTVSGGPTGAKLSPVFAGGDYAYPGQNKCKFFNTNKLHVCVNEPCNAPIFPAQQQQSGPADLGTSTSSTTSSSTSTTTTTTTSTSTSTTSASTTRAFTSGSLTTKAPQATTRSQPTSKAVTSSRLTTNELTTKAPTPVTTGSIASTTKSQTTARPSTTKAATTKKASTTSDLTSGAPNSPNCASLTNVVPSSVLSVSIENVDSWDDGFRVYFKMDVYSSISGWAIQIIWPSPNPQITDISSLTYGCSSANPNSHTIFYPEYFYEDLNPPNQVYFEIQTNVGNLDVTYLTNNIKTKVFKL